MPKLAILSAHTLSISTQSKGMSNLHIFKDKKKLEKRKFY